MFWRRYGVFVLVYLVCIAAFASLQVWKYADFALMGQLLGEDRSIDPEVVVIDLNAHLGQVRAPLAGVLETICGTSMAPRGAMHCTRGANALPKLIVLDVEFIENRGDPAEVDRLARVITALRGAGVRVYGAVLPSNPPGVQTGQPAGGRPIERLYSLLSGYGHTELWVVPFLRGFAWYDPEIETKDGVRIEALPLNVVKSARQSAQPTPVHDTRIVPLGAHQDFGQSVHSVPFPRSFAFTNDDWVLIGDALGEGEKTPTRIAAGDRSGFELLAWALADEKKRTEAETSNGAARYEPHVDVALMLILLALFSGLAVVVYRLIFSRVRARRFCFTLSFVGAVLVSLGALALLELLLLANHQLYSQVTLVAAGIVIASAVTARWTARDVHHQRFLVSLSMSAQGLVETERFDVFISYARDPENAAWVEQNVYRPLSQTLHENGQPLKVFFDRENLAVGAAWYERIVRAIHGSARFVAVYSAGYFDRWFCRDELELAMLKPFEGSPFIVPISRVGNAVPRRYLGIQFIDVDRNPGFIAEIVRSIHAAEATNQGNCAPR